MQRLMIIAAAIALAMSAPALAQMVDKNGRCHDAAGRFAKAEVCKSAPKAKVTPMKTGAISAKAIKAEPMAAIYKLDAKGMCHDAKGKLAKKDMCVAMKKP